MIDNALSYRKWYSCTLYSFLNIKSKRVDQEIFERQNSKTTRETFIEARRTGHPVEGCEACPRLDNAADSTMDHGYKHRVRPMSRILLNC